MKLVHLLSLLEVYHNIFFNNFFFFFIESSPSSNNSSSWLYSSLFFFFLFFFFKEPGSSSRSLYYFLLFLIVFSYVEPTPPKIKVTSKDRSVSPVVYPSFTTSLSNNSSSISPNSRVSYLRSFSPLCSSAAPPHVYPSSYPIISNLSSEEIDCHIVSYQQGLKNLRVGSFFFKVYMYI
jgi:hypothetical protein